MDEHLPQQYPLARTEQLIVKEVDDEVLVYDLKTDKAHCLNATAAQVWKYCDGEKSVTDITAALSQDSGSQVEEGVVWLALDQLQNFKLLGEIPAAPVVFAGMTRRQLVRTLGVAAIALPAITSILSPTTAEAASKAPPGACCVNAGDCSSSSCVTCSPVACPSCPSGKRCA
jgi:hypothetical protein